MPLISAPSAVPSSPHKNVQEKMPSKKELCKYHLSELLALSCDACELDDYVLYSKAHRKRCNMVLGVLGPKTVLRTVSIYDLPTVFHAKGLLCHFRNSGNTSRKLYNISFLKSFGSLPREENFEDPANPKTRKDRLRKLAQLQVSGRDFLLSLTIHALGLLGGVFDSLSMLGGTDFIQGFSNLCSHLTYERFICGNGSPRVRFTAPDLPARLETDCFERNKVILKTTELIIEGFTSRAIENRKKCNPGESFRRGACLQGVWRLSDRKLFCFLATEKTEVSYFSMLASSLVHMFCAAILKEMKCNAFSKSINSFIDEMGGGLNESPGANPLFSVSINDSELLSIDSGLRLLVTETTIQLLQILFMVIRDHVLEFCSENGSGEECYISVRNSNASITSHLRRQNILLLPAYAEMLEGTCRSPLITNKARHVCLSSLKSNGNEKYQAKAIGGERVAVNGNKVLDQEGVLGVSLSQPISSRIVSNSNFENNAPASLENGMVNHVDDEDHIPVSPVQEAINGPENAHMDENDQFEASPFHEVVVNVCMVNEAVGRVHGGPRLASSEHAAAEKTVQHSVSGYIFNNCTTETDNVDPIRTSPDKVIMESMDIESSVPMCSRIPDGNVSPDRSIEIAEKRTVRPKKPPYTYGMLQTLARVNTHRTRPCRGKESQNNLSALLNSRTDISEEEKSERKHRIAELPVSNCIQWIRTIIQRECDDTLFWGYQPQIPQRTNYWEILNIMDQKEKKKEYVHLGKSVIANEAIYTLWNASRTNRLVSRDRGTFIQGKYGAGRLKNSTLVLLYVDDALETVTLQSGANTVQVHDILLISSTNWKIFCVVSADISHSEVRTFRKDDCSHCIVLRACVTGQNEFDGYRNVRHSADFPVQPGTKITASVVQVGSLSHLMTAYDNLNRLDCIPFLLRKTILNEIAPTQKESMTWDRLWERVPIDSKHAIYRYQNYFKLCRQEVEVLAYICYKVAVCTARFPTLSVHDRMSLIQGSPARRNFSLIAQSVTFLLQGFPISGYNRNRIRTAWTQLRCWNINERDAFAHASGVTMFSDACLLDRNENAIANMRVLILASSKNAAATLLSLLTDLKPRKEHDERFSVNIHLSQHARNELVAPNGIRYPRKPIQMCHIAMCLNSDPLRLQAH